MNLTLALKVIFIFVNMTVPYVVGLFPIFFKKCKKETFVGTIGNCFAAGIFLLIGIVHLLSEANDSFTTALGYSNKVAYVVAMGGYFFILCVEYIVFGGHASHHHHEAAKESPIPCDADPTFGCNENKPNENHEEAEMKMNSEENSDVERKRMQPLMPSNNSNQEPECNNINCPPTITEKYHPTVADYIPAIILTSALYIHSIFEGIAMGLLTTTNETLILGIAILLHHAPAALAHSLKMEGLNKYMRLIFLFIFCSSSSTGVAIGISLSTMNSDLIQAIFLSISAGTFIYIGGSEIIPDEFSSKKWRFSKFAAVILGFLPLGILSIYISS